MFNSFDSLKEVIEAASIHRLWLWALTIVVAILIWKNLKKGLRIDKLEFEIKMMKEEIKSKIEDIENSLRH